MKWCLRTVAFCVVCGALTGLHSTVKAQLGPCAAWVWTPVLEMSGFHRNGTSFCYMFDTDTCRHVFVNPCPLPEDCYNGCGAGYGSQMETDYQGCNLVCNTNYTPQMIQMSGSPTVNMTQWPNYDCYDPD
jgi:hypothetical protein